MASRPRTLKQLLSIDPDDLAEPQLAKFVYDLTDYIEGADDARDARLNAFFSARERRDPQIPVRVLAEAGRMTHSGVVNAMTSARDRMVALAKRFKRGDPALTDAFAAAIDNP